MKDLFEAGSGQSIAIMESAKAELTANLVRRRWSSPASVQADPLRRATGHDPVANLRRTRRGRQGRAALPRGRAAG